jgi:type II secretory pathway pseudopilin PulG
VRRKVSGGITLVELMVVTALVAVMLSIAFSSAGAGLDLIRLRSAADSVAAILARSMNRVERAQEPVEIVFNRDAGTVSARGVSAGWKQDLKLAEGITLTVLPAPPYEDFGERTIVLMPGAAFPGVAIELANRHGQRRRVRIDPVAGAAVAEAPPAEGEQR